MKFFAKKSGFTLVEMMIAVALFALIATFAIGSVLSIFDANRKSQSLKTVVDNFNFSIENMVRTVRFGSRYHCDNSTGSSGVSSVLNCLGPTGGKRLGVLAEDGATVVYWFDASDGSIWRYDSTSSKSIKITSSDTFIEYLKFYVYNTTPLFTGSDLNQPYAVVVIKGYVKSKASTKSYFSIETMMSQRNLDL